MFVYKQCGRAGGKLISFVVMDMYETHNTGLFTFKAMLLPDFTNQGTATI